MAAQVFISYASADQATANRVCETLEKAGFPCWIAPRDIPAGVEYPTAIVEAVQAARVLVLILTEHATASPHILTEVGHAFSGKKRIVPFRLSAAPLPEDLEYFLAVTQWLDAPDGCTDKNLQRLTEATRQALAGRGIPRQPAGTASKSRWLVSVAAILLMATTAAVVYWRIHRPPGQGASGLSTPSPGSNTSNIAAQETAVATPASVPVATDALKASVKPKTWVNPADGLTYVWIPPGEFTMGCSEGDSECGDDEEPAHPVGIERGFWLGQTEVTLGAYRRYVAHHGGTSPAGADDMPASAVLWVDAKDYCAAVGGRLPTEAEWEYAARGGKAQAYYGALPEIAWFAGNSGYAAHAVGKKKPNAYGLYDMLGNVREWVLDRYFTRYDVTAPATGPSVEQPVAANASTVARGGFYESQPPNIRVSHRSALDTDYADPTVGWRCASDHR